MPETTSPQDVHLASTLVELADNLVEDFDVVDLMALLTERCVELLGADAAGLLLADPAGNLHLMAATSAAIKTVELFQIQSDEGPCRDCFHTGRRVSTTNLADDADRWPRFAPVAAAAGFGAAHAIPLRLRGQVLGAMNLFQTDAVPLGAKSIATAQALADVATIAVLQSRAAEDAHRVTDQLQHALDTLISIEQATGIIAERHGCTIAVAFSRLRGVSRERRQRMGHIAQMVVAGDMDVGAS